MRLQTAERTRELAANTLAELDKQGQQLDVINRDLNEVPTQVCSCPGTPPEQRPPATLLL